MPHLPRDDPHQLAESVRVLKERAVLHFEAAEEALHLGVVPRAFERVGDAATVAALPTGACVGTVDEFQGRQAPIFVYAMASSSAVASPALFTPDCRSVRQMKLGDAFCRLAEMAGG